MVQTRGPFPLVFALWWSLVLGCQGTRDLSVYEESGGAGGADGEPTLRGKYADHFPIGAAIDSESYVTHADLLKTHFNSVTAENEMKFESLQPSEGRFTFTAADRMIEFASENEMRVRGHALVWHRQTPSWVFVDTDGSQASRELLLQRMQVHIAKVVGHFKGKIYAWDVVNEALLNDGAYRTGEAEAEDQRSHWYAILGKDYVARAFEMAHDADPDAKLFYNDYYNYLPKKQKAIYEMLKDLLEQGVPVHGVGMQCHLNIEPSPDLHHQSYYQTVASLRSAIELYASLGLEVQVTEMDVSVYTGGVTYDPSSFYTVETFTPKMQDQQAARYREFFDLFRESEAITGVTLWGISDDNTWLSEFSSGRQDFPLLFDVEQRAKPAFHAVIDF